MGTRLRIGLRVFAAVVAFGLWGCAARPWGVETLYVIEDIDEEAEARLERALDLDVGRFGFEVVSRSREDGVFRFRLTKVDDVSALRRVRDTICAVSHSARVPVVLKHTSMTFASVYGKGQARIEVAGTATPGATVVLDVGGALVEHTVDDSGHWAVTVRRDGKLSARGGWVYGEIRKGEARQYIRMNVLDTDSYQRILVDELPMDSRLRGR